MLNRTVNNHWDATTALTRLQNFSQQIMSQTESAFNIEPLVNQMKYLGRDFFIKASQPQYRSFLTSDERLDLEKTFSNLADWFQLDCKHNHPVRQHTATLQVALLKILRYIIFKTSRDLRDVFWSCNGMKLALTGAIQCHEAEQLTDMRWCLSEAYVYHERYFQPQSFNVPIQLRAPLILNTSLLTVLRLLRDYYITVNNPENSGVVLDISQLNWIELSPQQSDLVSSLCYNIGLNFYKHQEYENAVNWLKSSDRFATLKDEGSEPSQVLSLMAVCYFLWDVNSHHDRILHVLDCAGPSLFNTELRFRTLLSGKSNGSILTECVFKLFHLYLEEDESRINILKVFDQLESKGRSEVLVEILNRIPWKLGQNQTNCPLGSALMPRLQWLCAFVAFRSCIRQSYLHGGFDILELIAQWRPSTSVDAESLCDIMNLAEKQVASLTSSFQMVVQWLQTLVLIARRHGGIRTSLVIKAVRFSVDMNTPEGVSSAKQMLVDGGVESADADIQLFRLKLLVAILDRNVKDANESWLKLEAKYKKETFNSDFNFVESESFKTLEEAVVAAITNEMDQSATHCLTAMMLEVKKRPAQIISLINVIRFHLKVLFKLAPGNLTVGNKCIEHLVTLLISSFIIIKDIPLDDVSGLELWFGELAWSLARKLDWIMPFYRHQLFKVSYKMLCLTQDVDEDTKQKISTSIVLSVAAGINSENYEHQPYRKILESCLDIIDDYPQSGLYSTDDTNSTLVHFYKFYIYCELGYVKQVSEIVQRFQADERSEIDMKLLAGFAALASSENRVFLRQILPPVENLQSASSSRRELKLQLKLTSVAIECLKISIAFLMDQSPTPIDETVVLWQRIIVLASEHVLLHDGLMARQYLLCQDYRSFIWNNRAVFNPSDVEAFFNQVWYTAIDYATSGGMTEHANKWMQLANELASFSPELMGQVENLKKRYNYLI